LISLAGTSLAYLPNTVSFFYLEGCEARGGPEMDSRSPLRPPFNGQLRTGTENFEKKVAFYGKLQLTLIPNIQSYISSHFLLV